MHYDPVKRDLEPWYWYVHVGISYYYAVLSLCSEGPVTDTGERVPPSDLLEYRRTHYFRGPCCVCASLDSSDTPVYTEASIFVAIVGPCIGKYVAACATGQCRYWGESMPSAIVQYLLMIGSCKQSVSSGYTMNRVFRSSVSQDEVRSS